MSAKGILSRVSWWLFKRQRVGRDEFGNLYHRHLDKNPDGDLVERRYIKYGGEIDAAVIPPEWSQWLRKTRKEPPSDEDIAAGMHQRELQRQRALAAEMESKHQKLREQAASSAQPPRLDSFIHQLTESGQKKD